jgi:nucleotide-binding universal stress UspA family protein
MSLRKFTNILVAIDGSDHSIKAAEYSLNLAKIYGATLHAVTVSYIPESYHMKQEDAIDKSRTGDSIHDAKSWFEKFNQSAKENNISLKPELINSHRPIDYVLLEYAEQEKIDLIVVGTKGRSGFKRLLLGSVATGVVTYAHCPVIIVK